jgi:CTP synthase
VIALIEEWQDADGSIQKRTRSPTSAARCAWARRARRQARHARHEIYGNVVTERHRHRYEANVNYLDRAGERRAS